MIKKTISAVAAPVASCVTWESVVLRVSTKGTETCAVPTTRDEGIELVMFARPDCYHVSHTFPIISIPNIVGLVGKGEGGKREKDQKRNKKKKKTHQLLPHYTNNKH